MVDSFERAEARLASQKINTKGLELAKKFTYKETAAQILKSFE
jgi:hypothetical protein